MVDRVDGCHRLCLRHLRAAHGEFIVRPAIMELTGDKPGTKEFAAWAGRIFYIPAFAGGIFGLLGGYLTDRLGRPALLTWSILIYALSAFAGGYSTTIEMLILFRSIKFVGVCVEFVAAVAWLAELFPEHDRREKVLGYTQAFLSLGGLMVAMVYGLLGTYAERLPAIVLPDWLNFFGGAIKEPHAAWRYTMMSGLLPALPLIVIRPFLPESPGWAQKKSNRSLRRPSFGELFAPGLLKTTVVTTIMFACAYGAAFGAIQQIPQIVPGVPEVKAQTEGKPVPEQKKIEAAEISRTGTIQEVGGLVGRFLLALLAVRIVSRRSLLRVFLIPGLLAFPIIFGSLAFSGTDGVSGRRVLRGLFTVAQFSFWGNYLPRRCTHCIYVAPAKVSRPTLADG